NSYLDYQVTINGAPQQSNPSYPGGGGVGGGGGVDRPPLNPGDSDYRCRMAQGWTINAATDTITFLEAPPAGTNNVVVKEFAASAVGGTDVWAVGAWSARYGYPSEVEFFADRLWMAGTRSEP